DEFNRITIYNLPDSSPALGSSPHFIPATRLSAYVPIENLLDPDSAYFSWLKHRCICNPDFPGFDTALPVNSVYPLLVKKGQTLHFNAFNLHPETPYRPLTYMD